MTRGDGFDERLRERFVAPPRGAATGADCPDADRIWRAARGELPFAETSALLDHVAACAACTVAWRLAREQAVADPVVVGSASPRTLPWRWAAAAVVLVAVSGLALREWSRRGEEAGALRSTAETAIRAAVPDGAALPRSAFVLRWSGGPAGTRYTVLVTDERLAPVAEAANLDRTELRVPEASLAPLPAGARVLWQVKAVYPDGTRVASPTFVNRVEGAPR